MFLEPIENCKITIKDTVERVVNWDIVKIRETIENIKKDKQFNTHVENLINECVKIDIIENRDRVLITKHSIHDISEINANYVQTKYKLLTYVNKISNHEYVNKFINLYPRFSELEEKRQKRIISRAYTEWVCCNKETNYKPIDKINYLDKI